MNVRMVVAPVALLLLSACTSSRGDATPADSPTTPAYSSYVALGDSYTAGPLIPNTDVSTGCFRSDSNYPSLLAEQLDIAEFTDVSCSAATTLDLTGRQVVLSGGRVAPQLDALREDTELVTLGIGGNDFGLFATLLNRCTAVAPANPAGAPCAAELASTSLSADIRRIGARVADAVAEIRTLAPEATVVLVGYLRLAPATGTCAALPFADGDYPLANRISTELRDAVRRAARVSDAEFVDAFAASRGHDACSEQPWVNGAKTKSGRAFAYHPVAAGMRAVARLVEDRLAG